LMAWGHSVTPGFKMMAVSISGFLAMVWSLSTWLNTRTDMG
jgi:hypothetical protein